MRVDRTSRLELAEALVIEAEKNAATCPDCGCDWDDDHDPHQERCLYVKWADASGGNLRGARP